MPSTPRFLIPAFLAFACAAQAADAPSGPRPVRVGFVCPFTGPSQHLGASARLGAELAVHEVNEAGGYLGRPLELVARDDMANPDEGRRIAEDLVLNKKADFTVGFCNSAVALKSLDVFQSHNHLLMVPVATGTAITTAYPAASSYVFRISPPDALQASFLVDEIVRRGLTHVAIFADKTNYGEGGLKDLEKRLADKGLKPTYVARFDLGVASLASEMHAAKAAGANAVIGYTVGPDQATIALARAEAHMSAPLYGSWPMSFRLVHDKAGAAVNGAAMPQTIIPSVTQERHTSFLARLRHFAGNQRPVGSLMAAAQTYDAIHLMVRALFQTHGDVSGPALKHALESPDREYGGVVTTYDRPFSSTDHDAITANMLWLGAWHGNEIGYFRADDVKRAAMIPRKTH